MAARHEEDRGSPPAMHGELRSPFLDEELFVEETDAEREAQLSVLEAESPFRHALAERRRLAVEPEAPPVFGETDREGAEEDFPEHWLEPEAEEPSGMAEPGEFEDEHANWMHEDEGEHEPWRAESEDEHSPDGDEEEFPHAGLETEHYLEELTHFEDGAVAEDEGDEFFQDEGLPEEGWNSAEASGTPTDFVPTPAESPGGGRIQDKRDPPPQDLETVKGHRGRRVQLHRLAAAAWRALVAAARRDGIRGPLLLPISGYRSTQRQADLFRAAVKRYGSEREARKWVAAPGGSAHHSGRAIDFYLGGSNSSSNVAALRRKPAYLWLAKYAREFGFFPYDREPWHWEYNPPATLEHWESELASDAPRSEIYLRDHVPFGREYDEHTYSQEEIEYQKVGRPVGDVDLNGTAVETVTAEIFESEQSASIPSDVAKFAAELGRSWSKHKAERSTEWLLQDYQDTLRGARKRWPKLYGKGRFTVDAVTRAWMISRREQHGFETSSAAGLKPLKDFSPPAEPTPLVHSTLIKHSAKAPVAPLLVQFIEELRRRSRGVTASTYRGHGGGAFRDRGYSVDLWLSGRDSRGFYPPVVATELLRTVHEVARSLGVEWRVLYNDFSVADTINRETGKRNVVFMGTIRREKTKGVTGLNWHGPDPLILHFHLDLAPLRSPQNVGASVPSVPASASAPKPASGAVRFPAEQVRFAQRVLNAAEGEKLEPDAALGPLTRGALERFRRKYGLGPGGVLDEKTVLTLAQRALEELRQQSMFGAPGVLDAATQRELITFKSARGLGANATLDAATLKALGEAVKPPVSAAGAPVPTSTSGLDRILQLAANSAIARYRWRDRGVAPRGYIKGMALVYARVYCKLKAGDAAAREMAKANTGNTDRDALAHYAPEFRAAGMSNDSDGVDTLRHLFVLLIGLGMRESSGRYCVGRDRSASNTAADTAEAGLFQASYNLRTASPLLPQLFRDYQTNPSGFLDVFKEGVSCKDADLENFGSGDGREFQRLSKSSPAFAAEFAAVGLRNRRKLWGPINRKAAEIRPECDELLRQVEKVVDEFSLCPLVR
jgi:LAS superfamily LD-carboxypeptidase LdcB/peptidoglycan hydrolase-like protein with peptidoglycan-binding domain